MSESPKQNYELSGQIKLIREAQTFGAKGFTKREFVVTVEDGKYPQDIALECQGDKCGLLDGISEGDYVTAFFNLRGREYNGRYFNNLVCWKIESESAAYAKPDRPQIPADLPMDDGSDDSLPF